MTRLRLCPCILRLVLWSFASTFVMASDLAFASDSTGEHHEPEKGPHRGRLLKQEEFVVELSIFETGVPPEFRAWVTHKGKSLAPESVSLTVRLTRLGNSVDTIHFAPESDFLRGDMEIYEPHSFAVTVDASYQNKKYQWHYDNFEGRTRIETQVADAMNIETAIAGEAILSETIEVFGRLVPAQDAQRQITARFDGQIQSMPVRLGQSVNSGDVLATIESNESLKSYSLISPIDGVVAMKTANVSEQTDGRVLLSIVNLQKLTAELSVFPSDRVRVRTGAPASLYIDGAADFVGTITSLDSHLQSNQSTIVRVAIDNTSGEYIPGQYVTGKIEVDRYSVPLAVQRVGLQAFRDFTVVYAKIGEQYEVRMLELGRRAGEWVEVLGGLKVGAEYVTENSFVIKADIEKSGAAHDH